MNSPDNLVQNALNDLTSAVNSLANVRIVLNTLLSNNNGDGDALESGGPGSGRNRRRTGATAADHASEAAWNQSRIADSEGTIAGHTAAGDLHSHAGQEMKRAGHMARADEHFSKARSHYAIAKTLQCSDLNAANAGRPVVDNPKGSDSNYSDKGEYGDERRCNLEEAGGPFVAPDPETGNLTCPFCQKTFSPDESVSGKNLPEIVCPRCSGNFKMDNGRSIGTPSEE